MKKILVTGATGFVGNYVVEELLRRDFEVIASSSRVEKASQMKWFNKVIYKPFDFASFDSSKDYFSYFEKPDVLIHLAWQGLPDYKNQFHINDHLPAQINFLKNLIDNGLNDFTVAGTCLEYGLKEGCLSEEIECEPVTAYGIAKNELRKFLEKYTSGKNVVFKWMRLFYLYGKGQNPKSLFSQLENAIVKKDAVFNMSGGEQVRDYLPVEMAAEYIVAIAMQNKITGLINCCSGNPHKVIDVIEKLLSDKNASIILNKGFYSYPDYEPMAFWGNNYKLKKIINNE